MYNATVAIVVLERVPKRQSALGANDINRTARLATRGDSKNKKYFWEPKVVMLLRASRPPPSTTHPSVFFTERYFTRQSNPEQNHGLAHESFL
jgi:hypothetical protein